MSLPTPPPEERNKVLHVYPLPDDIGEIALRELPVATQKLARGRHKDDPDALAEELAKHSIAAISPQLAASIDYNEGTQDDRGFVVVDDTNMGRQTVFHRLPPRARYFLIMAYLKIHTVTEDELGPLLAAGQTVV